MGPLLRIDRRSPVPLHAQIERGIKNAIRSGVLAPGTLLPSTRELARQTGASRNTVTAAYDALASQRLIESTVGSGTRVTGRLPVIAARDDAWRRAIAESRYPQRTAMFLDPDGNPLFLSSR